MRKLTIINVAFPFAIVSADPVGGAEQILSCIDRALTSAGHRSIVIAAAGSQTAGELVSLPACPGLIGCTEWARAHEFLRRTIAAVASNSRADLIHMHGVDFPSYLPVPDMPVLATLHMPLTSYAQGCLDVQRPRTWFNTVSQHQHKKAASHPRVVRLIENGVAFSSDLPPAAKEWFAVALGRICPEKGFHLALDACKVADMPLKLAGAVSQFREHRRYFDEEIEPRLDGSRQWIGAISGILKWKLLQSAQALLAPSLVPETASLVAREALAAGTPVVAFPSGALAETIETGRTGFLVNDVEEMAHALSLAREIDPRTCRNVAEERYSAKRMIREYLECYEQLSEAQ